MRLVIKRILVPIFLIMGETWFTLLLFKYIDIDHIGTQEGTHNDETFTRNNLQILEIKVEINNSIFKYVFV